MFVVCLLHLIFVLVSFVGLFCCCSAWLCCVLVSHWVGFGFSRPLAFFLYESRCVFVCYLFKAAALASFCIGGVYQSGEMYFVVSLFTILISCGLAYPLLSLSSCIWCVYMSRCGRCRTCDSNDALGVCASPPSCLRMLAALACFLLLQEGKTTLWRVLCCFLLRICFSCTQLLCLECSLSWLWSLWVGVWFSIACVC